MNDLIIAQFLITNGIAEPIANFIGISATISLIFLLAYVSYWITKRYMVHVIEMVSYFHKAELVNNPIRISMFTDNLYLLLKDNKEILRQERSLHFLLTFIVGDKHHV